MFNIANLLDSEWHRHFISLKLSLLNWQHFRLSCGCVAVPVNWFMTLFHHFLLNLRTLYIVWSLVRRRVTRRLTRLQPMYNILKFSKKWWNNVKNQFTGTATQPQRNRKFCQFNNDQYCITIDIDVVFVIIHHPPSSW